jgi:hypothetical protein
MQQQTNGTDMQTNESASCRRRPALDVRVVAYFLYVSGSIQLVLTLLLATPMALPAEAHPVFFGVLVIDSNAAEAVYQLCMAVCNLACAWGLMRCLKWAWWFTLAYSVYYSIDAALILPDHQISTAITFAINAALIAWLWFRRQAYRNPGIPGTP